MKILDAKEIITLSIKVTETIHPKKALTFIRTSIVNTQVETCEKSYFYYHYSKNTKTYEIMIFPTNPQENIPEPFLLFGNTFHKNTDHKITVYLSKGYFIVIEKEELLLFKKIATELIEDIEIYLSQLYGLEDFEIIQIDDEIFTTPLQAPLKKLSITTYPLYEERSYLYFLIFMCGSFIFVSTFLYFTMMEKPKVNKIISVEKHLQKTKVKPMKKIYALLEDIQEHGIFITEISYESKKLKTTLYHTKKENLLLLTKKYKSRVIIHSLKFDAETKKYSMEVIFVL